MSQSSPRRLAAGPSARGAYAAMVPCPFRLKSGTQEDQWPWAPLPPGQGALKQGSRVHAVGLAASWNLTAGWDFTGYLLFTAGVENALGEAGHSC